MAVRRNSRKLVRGKAIMQGNKLTLRATIRATITKLYISQLYTPSVPYNCLQF